MTGIAELRDRSDDQLNEQLVALKKEQFNLRFQRASGQLENTSRFRVVRHDIARILTLLKQRATSGSPAAKGSKTKTPAAKARKAK